jgi:hypothetical protein
MHDRLRNLLSRIARFGVEARESSADEQGHISGREYVDPFFAVFSSPAPLTLS